MKIENFYNGTSSGIQKQSEKKCTLKILRTQYYNWVWSNEIFINENLIVELKTFFLNLSTLTRKITEPKLRKNCLIRTSTEQALYPFFSSPAAMQRMKKKEVSIIFGFEKSTRFDCWATLEKGVRDFIFFFRFPVCLWRVFIGEPPPTERTIARAARREVLIVSMTITRAPVLWAVFHRTYFFHLLCVCPFFFLFWHSLFRMFRRWFRGSRWLQWRENARRL